MSEPTIACQTCGRIVPQSASYVVRIDVFADPSIPPIQTDDAGDADESLAALLHELEHTSAEQLQDDVHRRFEYRLCRGCQRMFLANPLGLPRRREPAVN